MTRTASTLAIRTLAVVCVVVGVVWRMWGLGVFPGLDPDEVEGVLAWFRDPPMYLYVYPSGRPHLNVLAPLLHWPFEALLEPSARTVRLPAMLLGLATIPATWLMCRKPFGRPAAASAAVLVAASPFLVAYSRQAWDLAWVPLGSAMLIGFTFQRRWIAAGVTVVLLTLIHPTTLCLLPLALAPALRDFWVRAGGGSQVRVWRVGIVVFAAVAFVATYTGLAAVSRSAPTGSVETFVSLVGHGMSGTLAFAEFLGAPIDLTLGWRVIVVVVMVSAGGALVWTRGDWNHRLLLAAVVLGLTGQFISVGTDELMTPLRARYFLWSVVPMCLLLAAALELVVSRVRVAKAGLLLCSAVAGVWLWTFHAHYLQAFQATGGQSASLDYRAAPVQPKQQVLEVIRQQRSAPNQPVTVFVGEPRLHLGLMYLASSDDAIDVQNLGANLYAHQRDGRARLEADYAAGRADTFFVDYDWDHIDGDVREIHAMAARDVHPTVLPWIPVTVASIPTADGRPLLRVWRLVRR